MSKRIDTEIEIYKEQRGFTAEWFYMIILSSIDAKEVSNTKSIDITQYQM